MQNNSDLFFTFDPTFEQLILHYIRVYRDQTTIDQSNLKNSRLIKRESESDRYIYDNRLTAIFHLEDVRVGDMVEYAYSIVGRNPLFKEEFDQSVHLQYTYPVERLYIRLLLPEEENISVKYFNGAAKPLKKSGQGRTELIWDIS